MWDIIRQYSHSVLSHDYFWFNCVFSESLQSCTVFMTREPNFASQHCSYYFSWRRASFFLTLLPGYLYLFSNILTKHVIFSELNIFYMHVYFINFVLSKIKFMDITYKHLTFSVTAVSILLHFYTVCSNCICN